MVSPLSSRIINIECKANLRDGTHVVSDPSTAYPDRRRMKRSSVCSSDRDVIPNKTLNPKGIQISHAVDTSNRKKIPKLDKSELNLIASCIHHDIKNGKETVKDKAQKIQLMAPLTEDADMSCVSLHMTPCDNLSIEENVSHSHPEFVSKMEMLTWLELFRSSKPFYTDDNNLCVGEVFSTGNMSSITASSSCSRSGSRSPSVSDDNRSDDLSATGLSSGNSVEPVNITSTVFKDKEQDSILSKLHISTLDDAIRHSQPSARYV